MYIDQLPNINSIVIFKFELLEQRLLPGANREKIPTHKTAHCKHHDPTLTPKFIKELFITDPLPPT